MLLFSSLEITFKEKNQQNTRSLPALRPVTDVGSHPAAGGHEASLDRDRALLNSQKSVKPHWHLKGDNNTLMSILKQQEPL